MVLQTDEIEFQRLQVLITDLDRRDFLDFTHP